MALSAPIFQLKRTAKSISRSAGIPLNEALNRVAVEEGFSSWSELASSPLSQSSVVRLFYELEHGDIMLLGGRPRQGKTTMAFRLIVEAMKRGHQGVLFTLEYNGHDVDELFQKIGVDPKKYASYFAMDNSDNIDAPYIIQKLEAAPSGTVIVIDYLQLLDQRRESPTISTQINLLKSFAIERDLIIVLTSQIDRSYELSAKPFPDISDVRLPNPLDTSIFNKAYFMSGGEVQIQSSVA